MTERRLTKSHWLATAACLAVTAPAYAGGQATDTAQSTSSGTLTQPSTASSQDDATPDIVVTAQRRNERLQDVPISIANFSTETLQHANVQSLSEIDKLSTGVRFDKRTNFVVPTIRGITTNIVLAGGGSNVGVYLDGFYSPALQGSDIQLLNVDSIQVLKGPQGTLFGRNTTGGAIQVNTAEPNQNTRAVLEGGYGSYNSQRYQGYANVGLAEGLAGDVAVSYNRGNGWKTNIANGDDKIGRYKNFSIRTGLKLRVTDRLSLVGRFAYSDINDPTNLLQVPYIFNGRVAAQAAYSPGAVVATGRKEVSADEPIRYRFKSYAYQLKTSYDLDPLTITSYTQWRKDRQLEHKYSLDYTNVPFIGLDIHDSNDTFTQELLLTSKPGTRLQYTAGVFYFNADQRFPYVATKAGVNPYTFSSASGVRNKSIAGYADLTYQVLDNLFVTGGLRYTRDTVNDAFYTVGAAMVTTRLPKLKTSRLTPRAVIRYEFTPRTNVYASYSRGYKAAIYNVGGLVNDIINPEELDAFEIGLKHSARGFTANLSTYYYNYRDQQIVAGVLVNGIPVSRITNAASSHMYGVEGDFSYRVMPAVTLTAGFSYTHNRYNDFPRAPFVTQNANNSFTTTTRDASGFQMLRSPDFTGTLGANYAADLAGGKLVLSSNLYYTTKFFFDASNQLPQKEYAVLGLRAEWTDPSDRFTLAVSGKNVTNTRYYAQVASNAFGIGAVWAAPAIVEGSVRVKF